MYKLTSGGNIRKTKESSIQQKNIRIHSRLYFGNLGSKANLCLQVLDTLTYKPL